MSFVSKMFAHMGGSFLGKLWDAGNGGPLTPVSLAVDQYGTPIDFSVPPIIAGRYRNYKLAAGTPSAVAEGEQTVFETDRFGAIRVSFSQDGCEAPAYPLRDPTGAQVFSNTRTPVVASLGLAMDSRNQKPTAARVINGVHRFNTVAAGVYSDLVYAGTARLGRVRLRSAATYPLYLKAYDSATKIDEAALPAPVMIFELEPNAVTDMSLGDYVVLNGLALRITKAIEDNDKTAIALGDVRSFNLLYAR